MDEQGSTWEEPTAQVSPRPQDSGAKKAWRRFRALPTNVQVAAWIVTGMLVLGALGAAQDTSDVVVAPAVADETTEAERTSEPAPESTEDVSEEPTAEPTDEPTPAPSEEPAAEPVQPGWTVVSVVDGDTIDVRGAGGEERVRIIGIDTPERGECGFNEASAALSASIHGRKVELVGGARDDRDRYDRILRYVDLDGADAGLALINAGWATARYDSRDGYGRHPREDAYVAADAAMPHMCVGAGPAQPEPEPAAPPASAGGPGTGPGGSWKNCTEARDNGAAPVHRGDPGYGSHLDRDDDGIGCE